MLPAARATALSYAQVVFAALWGWLFFGEGLDARTAIGATLVLAATALSRPGSRPGAGASGVPPAAEGGS
jgi:drug/metabolite transporter (DMT)-like permease